MPGERTPTSQPPSAGSPPSSTTSLDAVAPLDTGGETAREEWTDYNGHMNLAYYVLIFDYATDRFLPMIGLGGDYRDRTDCSTFAVETHTNYLLEVMAGTRVRCTTQLLGFDEKRLHYFHRMLREDDGALSATTEVMAVHVDLSVRKVRPMPEDVQGRLGRLFLAHSGLERPREVGHVMRLGGGRGN